MVRNKLGTGSSLLVTLPVLVLCGVLAVLSAVLEQSRLMGLFLFLILLGGAARVWGSRAMKGVELSVHCAKSRLYPGESTELEYIIENGKKLPLIWLELSQSVPSDGCVCPDEGIERYTYSVFEKEKTIEVNAYRRTFSFLSGHERVRVHERWNAEHRGIYRGERLLLRAGDGFGLTQVEQNCPAYVQPELVVYPRPVPVDVSEFLRIDWAGTIGTTGHLEDPSVLRGVRPYQTTDAWKRINWRMAARQPGSLSVNQYETIQPASLLFILDGESFFTADDSGNEVLEENLEILGSVLTELTERRICCGLCLPRSRSFPAVTLPPEPERAVGELLYYLAGYACRGEKNTADEQAGEVYLPSRFDQTAVCSAAAMSGMTVVLTADPDGLPDSLMTWLEEKPLRIYSAGKTTCSDPERAVIPLCALKGGGKG